jgi:hypothetical protein
MKLRAAAGAGRSRSKACAWLLKKSFRILRKFARGTRTVPAPKAQRFNPPSPKNFDLIRSGLFVFNFEILRTKARRGNRPLNGLEIQPPLPSYGASSLAQAPLLAWERGGRE